MGPVLIRYPLFCTVIVRHLPHFEAASWGELDGGRPKSTVSHHFKVLREAKLVLTETTGNKWVLETLTLDMLYASAKGTEVPECRCKPQPQENGEQHTSCEWQRPTSKAVRADNENLCENGPVEK